MAKGDIRDDRSRIDHQHKTKRGDVYRNSGDFSRGANLINHQLNLWLGGAKYPIYLFFFVSAFFFYVMRYVWMSPYDLRFVFTKWLYDVLLLLGSNPNQSYDLVITQDNVRHITYGTIASNPFVVTALRRFWTYLGIAIMLSTVITLTFTFFYSDIAIKRGNEMLKDHHKRGAILVEPDILRRGIQAFNNSELVKKAKELFPNLKIEDVLKKKMDELNEAELHIPYSIAGIPFPYQYEQTHTMLIGTTGTGKTVVFKNIIEQIRAHNHSAVIFDLTGTFIESFYDPRRDFILNPFDQRCPNWSFFNDCETEPEVKTAAKALIPEAGEGSDPFWQIAARTLFSEMCIKLLMEGRATNKALVEELMTADLKSIHSKMEGTIADPLTSPDAARMAESIRAVFNANADILQCLPDEGKPFSIKKWIQEKREHSSILYIASSYTQKEMTRSLITLWINTALYSQMDMPNKPHLKIWFLLDELGALHKLPSLTDGFQTIRNQGGAIMVGLHSFAKMKEMYGDNATNNMINLTRNKLMLAVPDPDTAEICSKLIGNREVREVDEAYSISNNTNRDTSTLTANTQVEPLVLPDDLMNLQSLHGYLKMTDGFPTARIHLTYKKYHVVADAYARREGFIRTTTKKQEKPSAPDTGESGGAEVKDAAAAKQNITASLEEVAQAAGLAKIGQGAEAEKLARQESINVQNDENNNASTITSQETANAAVKTKKDGDGQKAKPEMDVIKLTDAFRKDMAQEKPKEDIAVAQQTRGTTDLDETTKRDLAPKNGDKNNENSREFDMDM
ncbi:MAG: type IV secretion system DNA-binding domain-containing protein [Sphingomonadales bacterium]|nr:type IV secretion system DNA-binding domain-containing protein [Sphingomonadales bacterium]